MKCKNCGEEIVETFKHTWIHKIKGTEEFGTLGYPNCEDRQHLAEPAEETPMERYDRVALEYVKSWDSYWDSYWDRVQKIMLDNLFKEKSKTMGGILEIVRTPKPKETEMSTSGFAGTMPYGKQYYEIIVQEVDEKGNIIGDQPIIKHYGNFANDQEAHDQTLIEHAKTIKGKKVKVVVRPFCE
jgi:hypothetical protein